MKAVYRAIVPIAKDFLKIARRPAESGSRDYNQAETAD